ncbi:LytR/AlgR family response regulator transcription factor [Anaerotalea alkaliphila]|uniref:Stage 0 sporulation protein A homolog n=1 Tax=Anaerotalea alkaliphila TaxID=2662126 RepID=A0A7X5HV00_9FIRM|nr:LytTR family DNA-binding domain-containing protein [Anaerotalea alkaliphila]NDL67138.1 response regulator transcription factor [Anaerotalea alkaliphila]
MAIKVMLVDDELPALEELAYMLETYSGLEVIGKWTNPLKALQQIILEEPDAVFLDVNMPEMDGFLLAEQLLKLRQKPLVVFVTAYDQYAVNAFELNAVDYVLKPVMEDRLAKTIGRLTEQYRLRKKEEVPDPALEKLLRSHRSAHPVPKLPLWKGDRIHLVNPSKIICCVAGVGGTLIHTAKETYTTQDTLSQLEAVLGTAKFFRCHRSYLINVDAVETVIPWFNNTYAVRMPQVDEDIPVSRRNLKAFKQIFHL